MRELELKIQANIAKNYYNYFEKMVTVAIIASPFVFLWITQAYNLQLEYVKDIIQIILMIMLIVPLITHGEFIVKRIINRLDEYGAIENYNFLKTGGAADIVLLFALVVFIISVTSSFLLRIDNYVIEALILSNVCFMTFIFPFAIKFEARNKEIKMASAIIRDLNSVEKQHKIKLIDVWNLVIKKIDSACKRLLKTCGNNNIEHGSPIYNSFKVATITYLFGNETQKNKSKKWMLHFTETILNDEITNEEKITKILNYAEQHQKDEDYNRFFELSKKHSLFQKHRRKWWGGIYEKYSKYGAIIAFIVATVIQIVGLLTNNG